MLKSINKMKVDKRRGVIVKRRTIAYAPNKPNSAPPRDIIGELVDGPVEPIYLFL